MDREPLGDRVEKGRAEAISIWGLWGGEVLAGGKEDSGQSDDVLEEVGELAMLVMAEN